jgi:MYXO-CTERM domain-containing protein
MRSLLLSLLFACGLAQAAPVALNLNASYGFSAYSGTAAVNAGNLDLSNTLFYIRENEVAGVQAWYLFFDPQGAQSVQASIDFGGPILDVLRNHAGLAGSVATYGTDVDGDGVLNDYANRALMGLEPGDIAQWTPGGSTLSIDWNAIDPGDHVRVLVQMVPEPGSAALAALGLLALVAARRRKTR